MRQSNVNEPAFVNLTTKGVGGPPGVGVPLLRYPEPF
jgi:hypothetical protein